MQVKHSDYRWLFLASLACFILAGSTGALFRFGLIYGLPQWGLPQGGLPQGGHPQGMPLQLGNVRHAHSHLMYFAWVTPALMALMGSWLPRIGEGIGGTREGIGGTRKGGMGWLIGATIGLGLLAYPPFLLYGYTVAQIGTVRLPLSMIAASLNALTWYVFAGLYVRMTWGITRSHVLRLWDAAVGFLILASFGAAGRGILVALKVTDPFWEAATVHLFLDLFSDGWFMLALLGMLYAARQAQGSALPAIATTPWATRLIITGLPVTFLLGTQVSLVPPPARLVAGIGGILVAVGLLLHIRALWPTVAAIWRLPLAFLALKAMAELIISLPGLAEWAERMAFRIPYLHWLLLGFVTLGLIAAAADRWGIRFVRHYRWMMAAILLLQLSLIPLTGLWPIAWRGRWLLVLAAWSALAPVVAATGLLIDGSISLRRREEEGA